MKSFLKKKEYLIDEAAMQEECATLGPARVETCDPFEENLIGVALAEAADYDHIHKALIHEHMRLCKAA